MKSIDRSNPEKQNELDIARRAIKFRKHLDITDKTYVDIIDILEFRIKEFIPEFKLMVRRDIELNNTAETHENPPRIFVRETVYDAACEGDQECRRILAHELAHLMLHYEIEGPKHRSIDVYEPEFYGMNSLDSSEDQADIYARNFLVPPFLAFQYRNDILKLSSLTGTPVHIAKAAATISRRQEMLKIRQPPSRVSVNCARQNYE